MKPKTVKVVLQGADGLHAEIEADYDKASALITGATTPIVSCARLAASRSWFSRNANSPGLSRRPSNGKVEGYVQDG